MAKRTDDIEKAITAFEWGSEIWGVLAAVGGILLCVGGLLEPSDPAKGLTFIFVALLSGTIAIAILVVPVQSTVGRIIQIVICAPFAWLAWAMLFGSENPQHPVPFYILGLISLLLGLAMMKLTRQGATTLFGAALLLIAVGFSYFARNGNLDLFQTIASAPMQFGAYRKSGYLLAIPSLTLSLWFVRVLVAGLEHQRTPIALVGILGTIYFGSLGLAALPIWTNSL